MGQKYTKEVCFMCRGSGYQEDRFGKKICCYMCVGKTYIKKKKHREPKPELCSVCYGSGKKMGYICYNCCRSEYTEESSKHIWPD